jgi:ribonuclease HI
MREGFFDIYTDGSCNPQQRVGSWVAIIIGQDTRTELSGIEENTTHNSMELLAVIRALEFIRSAYPAAGLRIFCDSQYVTGLQERGPKLIGEAFKTKNGLDMRNAALVRKFLELLQQQPAQIIKIKGHNKSSGSPDPHRDADKLCRKILRKRMA